MLHRYPSEMAQNFWTAIWAWVVCFVVTIVVSLMTQPRPEAELTGLVYSLTERPSEKEIAWYRRPVYQGMIVIGLAVLLNFAFR